MTDGGEDGAARRRALGRGRRAEAFAALYLRCKGYRILARAYRTPVGEIDVIAMRGRTLAMVEVKYRPGREAAAYAITDNRKQRIARAAGAFIAAHPQFADRHIRFDALLLAPGRWPEHVRDAWRM
ncbi:MAG TPA: YraN family protein [Alphaproteobacteria bacterium]|nr:YraN family protein [Alphaproteobacteria bacterium]